MLHWRATHVGSTGAAVGLFIASCGMALLAFLSKETAITLLAPQLASALLGKHRTAGTRNDRAAKNAASARPSTARRMAGAGVSAATIVGLLLLRRVRASPLVRSSCAPVQSCHLSTGGYNGSGLRAPRLPETGQPHSVPALPSGPHAHHTAHVRATPHARVALPVHLPHCAAAPATCCTRKHCSFPCIFPATTHTTQCLLWSHWPTPATSGRWRWWLLVWQASRWPGCILPGARWYSIAACLDAHRCASLTRCASAAFPPPLHCRTFFSRRQSALPPRHLCGRACAVHPLRGLLYSAGVGPHGWAVAPIAEAGGRRGARGGAAAHVGSHVGAKRGLAGPSAGALRVRGACCHCVADAGCAQVTLFDSALAVAPGSAKVQLNVGINRWHQHRWEEAMQHLDLAERIDPEFCQACI